MPSFEFTSPEGKKYTVQGPDGATKEQAFEMLQSQLKSASTTPTAPADDRPGMLSTLGGALGKGFGSTVLGAQKLVGKGLSAVGASMAPAPTLSSLVTGQKPDSMLSRAGKWLQDDATQGQAKLTAELAPYKAANPLTAGAGELGGEIIATLPVGGVLAKGVMKAAPLLTRVGASAPAVEGLANAIGSGGFRTGLAPATTLAGKAADLGLRVAGGGITGEASAAMVNSDHAVAGGVIGAALPGVAKFAGAAGNALSQAIQPITDQVSNKLMRSALKPTIAAQRDGSAQTAVDTLLQYGINPTKGGVNKLRELIDGLNTEIADKIGNSGATVDKQKVLNALADTRTQFTKQVSPAGDMNAIQGVADGFVNHPLLPTNDIPVALAQELKQGTYKILAKKYGQVGAGETEAQKGLARGLKEGIADAVPGVQGLNAEESKLLSALSVTERRVLMAMNNNPVGIAGLAHNPLQWGAMMLDKSPLFKSLAARLINASGGAPQAAATMIERGATNPLLRASAPVIASDR